MHSCVCMYIIMCVFINVHACMSMCWCVRECVFACVVCLGILDVGVCNYECISVCIMNIVVLIFVVWVGIIIQCMSVFGCIPVRVYICVCVGSCVWLRGTTIRTRLVRCGPITEDLELCSL